MPYVVSPTAGQPNAWDYTGQAAGNVADLLLKAILASQVGMVPPSQGSLNLPGGGTAKPGPGLQNQLANNQLPQLIQQGQFQPGTTYQAPQAQPFRMGPFQVNPSIDQLIKQENLRNTQAGTAYMNRLGQPQPQAQPTPSGLSLPQLQVIADKADAGDATAKAVMDYLLSQQ